MDRVRVGSSFLLYLGINFLFELNGVIEICFLEVVFYMCLIFFKKIMCFVL